MGRRHSFTGLPALTCLTLTLACTATSDDPPDADPDSTESDPDEPSPVEDLAMHQGVWAQRGYARILEITEDQVIEHHSTQVSCVRSGAFPFAEIEATHDRIMANEGQLSWYELGHFTRAEFDRIDALPLPCEDAGTVTDPEANFEALWNLFAENYAYFDVRGVDWAGRYGDHRDLVEPTSTTEELFAVFEQMLVPLDDGHVFVFDGVSQGFLSGSLGILWEQWAAQYEGEPVTNPVDPRRDFIVDMQHYVLDEVLDGSGQSGLYDTLHWGWVAAGVGYLDVHEMAYPTDDPPTIPQMQQEIDDVMTVVMSDLAGADRIIIDARFNQGGRDTMGYAIAGWFTPDEVLVSRKRAVFDGDWTEEQDIHVDPRGPMPFTGSVVLLTSTNTISAAETFTLAMRTLPTVTTVGTSTYGVFSDVLLRQLPNGWLVALSNEVYEAPDGSVYEGVGVPPDVEVPYDPALDFAQNLRAPIDAAIALP